MEVGYLVDALRRVRKYHAASMPVIEGELDGKIVAIAIGGMGRAAARRAAGVLLDGHRPSWIISAGFAGALDPELERNDLAVPAEVVDPEGRRFPIVRPESLGTGVQHSTGRLLTVDRLILDASEKTELHRQHGGRPGRHGILGGRRPLRRAARPVPGRPHRQRRCAEGPAARGASLMTQSGSYRIGAAFQAIWNRPSSIKDFWTLHEHALEAADRLARFVVRCVGELPA